MMSSKEEETLRFFQYVEENGLRAYNGLVAQNLDHARNERNRIFLQEKNEKKRKQEEAIKRWGKSKRTQSDMFNIGDPVIDFNSLNSKKVQFYVEWNAGTSQLFLQEEVGKKWDKWLEGPHGNGCLPYFGEGKCGLVHPLLINFSHLD